MCQAKRIRSKGLSNNSSEDLQKIVMMRSHGLKIPLDQSFDAKERYNGLRSPLHLLSLDECFGESNDDHGDIDDHHHRNHHQHSDQESINSQASLDEIITSRDDDSIWSEAHFDSDDNSLASIISEAYSTCTDSSCEAVVALVGSQRRVIFVPQQNKIHYIPHRHEYTPEEITSTWYRRRDMALMKMKCLEEEAIVNQNPEMLIEVPEIESFPEELSSSSLSMALASPLHGQHVSGAFHRRSCKPTDQQCEARIHTVIDAVMDEQENQWLDHEEQYDGDQVAQASLQHSRICARDALQRAHLDALEAIPIYLEGGRGRDISTIESVGSGLSQSSRRSIIKMDSTPLSPRKRLSKMSNKLRAQFAITRQSSCDTDSESRWNEFSSKLVLLEGSATTMNRPHACSDELMAMPKRMLSNHDPLAMPKRTSTFELEDADEWSVASSSGSLSINSELEFGGEHDDGDDDYEEELTSPESASTSITADNKTAKKTTNRTCKFFFKPNNHNQGGIYHKLKRKLKGSKSKCRKMCTT